MKPNPGPGWLMVFEGLDCSGKTSVAQSYLRVCENNGEAAVYVKGMGSKTWIGRLARRFPSTLLFMAEQLYITDTQIVPALEAGKLVVVDRYFYSIASHVPQTEKLWNKVLLNTFSPRLILPDCIVKIVVSALERTRRLQQTAEKNRWHKILLEQPDLITTRLAAMDDLLEPMHERIITCDTTGQAPYAVAFGLRQKIINDAMQAIRQKIKEVQGEQN